MKSLKRINFGTIQNLALPSELIHVLQNTPIDQRTEVVLQYLRNAVPDGPPLARPDGPVFEAPDSGPVTLDETKLSFSDDNDQVELLEECRIMAAHLSSIATLAANCAPHLKPAIERYEKQIAKTSTEIGARSIWSTANTLSSILSVHNHAIAEGYQNDELPPAVRPTHRRHYHMYIGDGF